MLCLVTEAPVSLRVLANGLEHHVLEWRGGARPLLLVHGYMDAAGTWDHVAPILAEAGYRVLAPDMRGFGEGPRVREGAYYHFADYVADVAALIEALAPNEPVGLVGHSMGGTIVTLYAGSFPERVSRLVNVEGLGPPDHSFEAGPTRMRIWIEQVQKLRPNDRPMSEGVAEQRLAANHPAVPPSVLATRLRHLVTECEPGRYLWKFDPLHRTMSPVPFFAKLFIEFAKRVTCPVLFVSGGELGFHPPDEEERLAAFGNLERATIADAGHMVHWTRPAEIAALLVRFLT